MYTAQVKIPLKEYWWIFKINFFTTITVDVYERNYHIMKSFDQPRAYQNVLLYPSIWKQIITTQSN